MIGMENAFMGDPQLSLSVLPDAEEPQTFSGSDFDMVERLDVGLLLVQGDTTSTAFVQGFEADFGVGPPRDRKPVENSGLVYRRIGEAEWLVTGTFAAIETLEANLRAGSSERAFVATAVTHGRFVVDVSGAQVIEVMEKCCALDFDAKAFPIGLGTRTRFATITAYLERMEQDAFRLVCDRAFASHLWSWVKRAAMNSTLE